MSEYIVDVGNADKEYVAYFKCKAETLMGNPIREEIVRCRDCTYYDKYPNDEISVCYRFDNEQPIVEPDGFCAWAYRKIRKHE